LCVEHLVALGYRIIARNHRCRGGELDVVAWDGNVLCFVEVRSRATDAYGDPLESITPQKIHRIVCAARDFVAGYLPACVDLWPMMRFDALGVVLSQPPQLRLVRDAFEAP
jgi:putative endonuclease